MLACGMEVILVKVAGVGLGVDIVGKNLRDIMPLLRRLVCLSPCSVVEIQTDGQESRYGSHPAGEGGEYETLTLSTPLFSHTIELEDAEVVVTDPEPYPVAYLRVPGGKLVKKENWVRPGQEELRRMLGLDGVEVGSEGLDEAGLELLAELRTTIPETNTIEGFNADLAALSIERPSSPGAEAEAVRFNKKGKWFGASVYGATRPGESIGDELRRCFDSISGRSSPRHDGSRLIDRYPDIARFITRPTRIPYHAPPSIHVTFRSRQCRLYDLLRHFPSFSSYCCCPTPFGVSYTS
jgi:diphthine-ammonia ligase